MNKYTIMNKVPKETVACRVVIIINKLFVALTYVALLYEAILKADLLLPEFILCFTRVSLEYFL